MSLREKIVPLVEKVCEKQGVILVDVEVKGDGKRPVYMVYADTEEGITLDQCVRLSRALQDEIDIDENFPVQYRIDVSSPGLERPLIKDFQYRKNIGRNLKIKYKADELTETVSGKLIRFDENELELADRKKRMIINRRDILEAKIKLQW